jgi:hypothetical protein
MDWDPNTPGNQAVAPALNKALFKTIDYTGPTGHGEGHDYLASHPQYIDAYTSLRHILDPNYKFVKAKGGEIGYNDGGMATEVPATEGSVDGDGGGKDDKIPALLSDGEHVITAQEVSALGDGSNKEGQRRLYEFRKRIRAHASKNKSGHSPKSKPLSTYMKGI